MLSRKMNALILNLETIIVGDLIQLKSRNGYAFTKQQVKMITEYLKKEYADPEWRWRVFAGAGQVSIWRTDDDCEYDSDD